MTVTDNKVQLIDLIVETLHERWEQLKTHHELAVTGSDPVPIEIHEDMTIHREDMRNTQEEADVIIIHQLLSIVEEKGVNTNISGISDDTDVFILFVHLY